MPAHPELADRIGEHAPRLAERVAESFATDPFWASRFGDDGRTLLREQAMEHIERLARALRVGDAAPVTGRMREVRADAVRGGLTTRQLEIGSRRLEEAIRAEGIRDAGAARTMLDRAVLALRYDDPIPAAVQDASRQLAEDAVVTLRGVRLGDEATEAQWIEALEIVVSYLADALGQHEPRVLADHLHWLAAAGSASARPASPDAMVDALDGALDELPPSARDAAARCLAAARASTAV